MSKECFVVDINVRLFCNLIQDHIDQLSLLLVDFFSFLDCRIVNVRSYVIP